MVILVATYKILTTYSGTYGGLSFSTGKLIRCYYDDVTETSHAELCTVSGTIVTVESSLLVSGPDLSFDSTGTYTSVGFIGYRYCNGTTGNLVTGTHVFPYIALYKTLNSSLCAITPVGDLKFVSSGTIVNKSSDLTTPDGNLKVTATTSNGPTKYSLDSNFNYATQGQLTGVFTGLLPGVYTVYAKDTIGSNSSIKITITALVSIGIRWRIQYKDLSRRTSRIDIYKKGYAGELEYITAGEEPITIKYMGDENDLYKVVIPSNAEIQLMCEVEDQFQEIFTTDDRNYLVKFYKDEGITNLPIPVPAIDALSFPVEPSLSALSTFTQDSFSAGVTSWNYDSPYWITAILGSHTTKYLISNFIAKAGVNYSFHYDFAYSDFNGNHSFLGSFEIVLLDAANVIVASYVKTFSVIASGTPHEIADITLNPSADCVKVGFRFIQTSSVQAYYKVYALNYTGWDASILRATADVVFIPTKDYSFDYNISSSSASGIVKISVCDDAYNDLLPPLILTGSVGNYIGNYYITAPSGATKIKVTVFDATLYTFDVVSFNRIPIYVSSDTFSLKWVGYVIPEYYQAPYLAPPYVVTITASDGLGEIGNYDFVDTSLNDYTGTMSALSVINEILKTTDLNINIRSSVNVYESAMDQNDNKDPLDQAFIDPGIFYDGNDIPKKMDFVLESMLTPFGAKIFQSLGLWWIVRVEYSVSTTLVYREFDSTLTLVENEVFTPIINIKTPSASNRFAWTGKTQALAFLSDYGKMSITHDLSRDNNLIDEGRFEARDLITKNGVQFFKNWNILLGQTGMQYGIQGVNNGNSKGSFYASFSTVTSAEKDSILYSAPVHVKLKSNEVIKVTFDISMIPYYNNLTYLRFAWRLRVTDTESGNYYDFKRGLGDYSVNSEFINEEYITSYDSFQSFDLGLFGFPVSNIEGTVQLSFYFHNHYGRDLIDASALKGDTTAGMPEGIRRYTGGNDIGGTSNTSTRSYILQVNTSPESIPSIVRPNDYDSVTNPRQWVLQQLYSFGPSSSLTKKILIDNVKIAFYYYQSETIYEPPVSQTLSRSDNTLVKNNLDKTVYVGDLPLVDNATGIYNGYFRLSDGTPTVNWRRKGISEALPVLRILLNDYYAQLGTPARKIRSTGYSDVSIAYINALLDRDGKRFTHTRLTIYDKNNGYDVNIVQVKTGDGGEPPVDLSAFSLGFSNGFYA